MISLFLDTSSNYLTVGILKDNILLKQKHIKLDKTLSKMALVCVKEVIELSELKPIDIDEIICVNGPGSFTGLRVGVTIAKTYAWSLNKKISGVSSLFVMATSVNNDYIIPIIDARRGYVYAGIYDKNYKPIMEDKYISLDKLKEEINKLNGNYTFVSNDEFDFDVEEYKPNLNNLFNHLNKNYAYVHSFIPNYLKKTEAEENLNK